MDPSSSYHERKGLEPSLIFDLALFYSSACAVILTVIILPNKFRGGVIYILQEEGTVELYLSPRGP